MWRMWSKLMNVYKNISPGICKDHMHLGRQNHQSNALIFVAGQRYLVIYLVIYKFGNASFLDQERIKKDIISGEEGGKHFW